MAQKKKRSKKRSELEFNKVPIEIALEDRMRHEAENGAKRFWFREFDGDRKRIWFPMFQKVNGTHMFVMFWEDADGEVKYTAVETKNLQKIASLRLTFKMYVREMNRELKWGKFEEKPEEGEQLKEVMETISENGDAPDDVTEE